jgi:hypothetical protein
MCDINSVMKLYLTSLKNPNNLRIEKHIMTKFVIDCNQSIPLTTSSKDFLAL